MQIQQYIQIPSGLFGFHNIATTVERTSSGRDVYLLHGELLQFTKDLLAYGSTNKEVAELTGLGKNTVKEIDLQRQTRILGHRQGQPSESLPADG